jgi:hypothetical protein
MKSQQVADRLVVKIDHAIEWMESAARFAARFQIKDHTSLVVAWLMLRLELSGVEYEDIVKAISLWRKSRMSSDFKETHREVNGNGDSD